MKVAAEQTHTKGTRVPIHISVVGPHIDDTGRSSSVARRKEALVKGNLLDRFGHEDRKKPEHVIDIIERHAVQQHQVVRGSASTDIQAGKPADA